uniref:Dirigent protein n=2 Tax=Aegilops tauschii subsp. strangulata TaxID=200361 RepID=A0A453JCQ1_AEGTS
PRLHVPLTHTAHEKDRASKNLSIFLTELAMAIPPKNALYSLLLVSSFILGAMADPALSCPSRCEEELQWTLYARQIGGGANANQEEMVHSVHPTTGFGTIVVNNWDVLDAPLPTATIVARARGTHTKAGPAAGDWFTSLSIVFEGARFNGSTFQVMGITNTDGQWAIVGGTKELSRADGTIKHTVLRATALENYRQLDIRAFYTPPAVNANGIAA